MLNVLFLSAGNKGEMFVGLMGKRSLVEGEANLYFLANVVNVVIFVDYENVPLSPITLPLFKLNFVVSRA